jgi:hypothetical protein
MIPAAVTLYWQEQRIHELEVALRKHHGAIGCVNYCRTGAGHFNWEDPDSPINFAPDEQGCEHCGSIEVNPKCPACNGIER